MNNHPFLKSEPEVYVVSHNEEEERRKQMRSFPEDSVIMSSNRAAVAIFIKQNGGKGIDFDGVAHVYKQFKPDFKLDRDKDLRPFLVDVYKQYDTQNNIVNDFPREIPA